MKLPKFSINIRNTLEVGVRSQWISEEQDVTIWNRTYGIWANDNIGIDSVCIRHGQIKEALTPVFKPPVKITVSHYVAVSTYAARGVKMFKSTAVNSMPFGYTRLH